MQKTNNNNIGVFLQAEILNTKEKGGILYA